MKITGACHCGKLSYEAEIDPAKVQICHCNDCQTFSGAPYRASVPVKTEDFVLHGSPRHYIKTAESGNKRAQGFCENCGSPLYSTQAENPSYYMLRLGAIKQRAELKPARQIWKECAMPWVGEVGAIPAFTGQK